MSGFTSQTLATWPESFFPRFRERRTPFWCAWLYCSMSGSRVGAVSKYEYGVDSISILVGLPFDVLNLQS